MCPAYRSALHPADVNTAGINGLAASACVSKQLHCLELPARVPPGQLCPLSRPRGRCAASHTHPRQRRPRSRLLGEGKRLSGGVDVELGFTEKKFCVRRTPREREKGGAGCACRSLAAKTQLRGETAPLCSAEFSTELRWHLPLCGTTHLNGSGKWETFPIPKPLPEILYLVSWC